MNLGADREGGPRSGQARDFPRPEIFQGIAYAANRSAANEALASSRPPCAEASQRSGVSDCYSAVTFRRV